MENLKIKLNNDLDEIIELLKQLGCKYFNHTGSEKNYLLLEDGKVFFCKLKVNFRKSKCREVTIDQLRDMVILHRNDVSDANYGITIASDRPDTPVYKTSDAIYYTYSDHNNKWVFCNSIKSTTTGLKKINKQPDAAAPMNDIARTAEVHREHNLPNELNDLCAEFGCPPGMDRFAWLKDQLDISQGRVTLGPLATKARMQQESMELRLALLKDLSQPQPVTYHYAASINTARGTVAYDGVITMPVRITGIEDYQKARAEIAKDGNVAPEQVNIHSLSVIN